MRSFIKKLILCLITCVNLYAIEIAFVIDENAAWLLGACLRSLLLNAAPEDELNIHVLHNKLESLTIGKLKEICKIRKCNIEFIYVTTDEMVGCESILWPKVTCIKGKIPLVLDKLDKVLLLDADMIIKGSLSELWNIELGDHYAAVSQGLLCHYPENVEKVTLKNKADRFSSAIILFNAKKYREDNMFQKFIEDIRKNKCKCDDEALSNIFNSNTIFIDPKWNVESYMFNIYDECKSYAKHSEEAHNRALEHPAIIHYSSKTYYNSENPFIFEFMYYLRDTPFNEEYKKAISKITNSISPERVKMVIFSVNPIEYLYAKIMHLFGKNL